MIDREQIYKWWSVFHDEGEITEIRALGAGAIYSGYYKSIENAIRDIEYLDKKDDLQIYFIINAIREDCYGRVQREKLAYKPKTTTDAEIIGRKWLMIDLDPKRTSGISSTNEELEYAHQKAKEVYKFLRNNGFNEPIICMSGNGYHLMYSCRIAVSPETDKLVERFINALAMIFSDDKVDVDTQCKNNARLSKLYGTTARKGSNSPDRPWRMSKIVRIPNEIKVNDIEYIKKIANLYPEEKITPSIDNNWGQEKFDVENFLNKHNIEYKKENYNDGDKYVLKHCAFNESHTGKDAVVFQRNNGALAYVCLHNSCSHYTWKDFRLKFEPNAYDKKDYKDFQYKQRNHSRTLIEPFTPQEESEEKGKKWLSMKEIKRVDIDSLLSIPTGYEMLDKKIVGLFAGELTIVSGLNASGKTSWLDCLALNVIQGGFKVGIWSGEMQDWRFQGWINQIAAGKSYVKKKQGYDNLYYTPTLYCEKIENWLDGKLFLYNNSYGSKWEQLFSDIKELVEREKVQLIILDNLAALSIDGYDGEKYSRQTKFILDVKEYAKQKNIHIILVAHPRKESTFLRKESISGTADLTNIADNLMLLHRVGKDFEIRAGEFLGKDKVQEYMGFSTVLEVVKNRQFGVVDYLVGMYYEMESRRLKNSIAEHIVYGWNNEDDTPQNTYTYSSEFQNISSEDDYPLDDDFPI